MDELQLCCGFMGIGESGKNRQNNKHTSINVFVWAILTTCHQVFVVVVFSQDRKIE